MKRLLPVLFAFLAAARAFADPPAGYKDVTSYSGGSWGSSFGSLVRDDPSAASANARNLNRMIAKDVVLYFPAGTYWIDKTIAIGKTGVTLWGDEGAVICRTGVPNTCATAFPLAEFKDPANFWITASGFKMHGLTIKYDVPTSFTGVVTAKSSNTATVRLTDGQSAHFGAETCISRVNYFDEDLRPSGSETFFDAGSKLAIANLATNSDGVATFKCTLKGSSVGQRIGMACGSNYGQNIVFWGSGASVDDAVFEDVTVANSFGMVMLVRGVRNLTLERFRVDDGDPDTIYTASVDGIHVTALGGKLTMKDCEFNGLADDILNVHCTGAKVGSVDGSKVAFESGVDGVFFQRGQTVRFYSSKFADLGTAAISSVTASSGSVTAITVDALPSGVAAGCHVANESWLPEVEITGTKVGVTRARGFLLQTDKPVTIADCEISNTRLAGILCAPGASWGEMGPVDGVTVSNCTFRACGAGVASTSGNPNAAIVVRCEHDAENAAKYAQTAQRNVRIEGNLFADCPASAVSAANASGLVVTNNVFLRCGGAVPAVDSCMVRLRTSVGAKVVYNTAYGGGFTNDVLSVSGNANVEAHHNGFRDESEYGDVPTPVFASGGGALSFPDAATFRIALVETDPGFWYTAFAANDLDGDFVSESASVGGTGGALALDVAVDGARPARFVRVAVSRESCEAGVSLAAFLAR